MISIFAFFFVFGGFSSLGAVPVTLAAGLFSPTPMPGVLGPLMVMLTHL